MCRATDAAPGRSPFLGRRCGGWAQRGERREAAACRADQFSRISTPNTCRLWPVLLREHMDSVKGGTSLEDTTESAQAIKFPKGR